MYCKITSLLCFAKKLKGGWLSLRSWTLELATQIYASKLVSVCSDCVRAKYFQVFFSSTHFISLSSNKTNKSYVKMICIEVFAFDLITIVCKCFASWGQFHQSVDAKLKHLQIPKAKKAAWVDCLFALLGSASVKAASKMLVKLTIDQA